MGVVKEKLTETSVLSVSFHADSHQPTVRIFGDHTCSLSRLQRPYIHIGNIIPHNDKHRYFMCVDMTRWSSTGYAI